MTVAFSSPVLLFDLGGVLIGNPGFQHFKDLLPDKPDLAELKARWLASRAVRRFESGQCKPHEFASDFIAEWQIEIAPDDFVELFRGWPADVADGAFDLVRRLRANYRVACLSNSNELHWARYQSFIAEFDVAISSHLCGRLKPDRDAFEAAALLCDARPADICFFDDSQQNIDGARSVGMHAFLVNDIEDLETIVNAALATHR